MPAGIIVYNTSGTVQIDDTYRNMALRAKSSSGTPTASGLYAYQRNETSGSVSWWQYDWPDTPTSTFGFQVFDASGNCTFDAMQKYARVVDVFAGPINLAGAVTKTYPSGRSYAVITAKRGLHVDQRTRPNGAQVDYQRRFVRPISYVAGANVSVKWTLPEWPTAWIGPVSTAPAPTADDLSSQFIVLDVTDH